MNPPNMFNFLYYSILSFEVVRKVIFWKKYGFFSKIMLSSYCSDYVRRSLGGGALTEKELRKLNRFQLLELLVMQTEQNELLQKQLEELKNKRVEDMTQISQMGSVAEASVQISGLFSAAQSTADMYLKESKKRAEEIVKDAYDRAEEILQCARDGEQRIKELKESHRFRSGNK